MKKISLLSVFLLVLAFTLSLKAQQKPVENDAAFSSQKIESSLTGGKTYNVTVSFKNTGEKTWRKGEYWIIYTDPRMNARNNNMWGIDSIKVKRNVKPGKTYDFKFKVTAPVDPGTYFFAWQMADKNGTFGLGSGLKEIQVK
ncbi:MAG: hypothetical protein JST55_00890 [Bacteroidetes bacterium]|nr:hypothetical protein [Bacteroidota bacterium]